MKEERARCDRGAERRRLVGSAPERQRGELAFTNHGRQRAQERNVPLQEVRRRAERQDTTVIQRNGVVVTVLAPFMTEEGARRREAERKTMKQVRKTRYGPESGAVAAPGL